MVAARDQTQGAPGDQRARKLRLGPRRGEGAPHPGRVRQSSSWLPELLGWGRHKTQVQPSPRFCGEPAPYTAAWSLSSVDGESTHARREWGKPSVAGTLRVLPTQASDICLQRPFLPTARLNKRTQTRDHLRPLVSGRKLDTEETGKQKPNKGNRFRRDRCNRLKYL